MARKNLMKTLGTPPILPRAKRTATGRGATDLEAVGDALRKIDFKGLAAEASALMKARGVRSIRRGRADTAAARPQITIGSIETRFGTIRPRVHFIWPNGAREQPAALSAQVYQAVADIFVTAAAHEMVLISPEIGEVMHAGRGALQATVIFETMGGTPIEADRMVDLIHDAIPAPE